MEKQFILRIPDELDFIDFSDTKIRRISEREIHLTYKNHTYYGVITKSPTIIETQKAVGNKLYKIADISGIVTVYPSEIHNINEEITKLEESGITSPMKYVTRRVYKRLPNESLSSSNIESRLNDLLREDLLAYKVEIITEEDKEKDSGLDLLVEELENEFKNLERPEKTSTSNVPPSAQKITPKTNTDNNAIDIRSPETVSSSRLPIHQNIISELQELEKKIAGKKDAVSKALNPIIKRRLEGALSVLEDEYKKKKEEYNTDIVL